MMRVDYKAFGKRLREYRLARHLTQEQLGELVGVSYQHIGMLERGKRSPSMEMLISLCYVLDCTCDSLLTDSLPEQTIYMLRQRPRRLQTIEEAKLRMKVYGEFVPKLMDEDEIRAIIKEVLAELQIDQPTVKDKGRIMKTLMPRVKGKADGGLVNQVLGSFFA